MKPVQTKQIRLSAKEVLLAALEGSTVTYSRVKADPESPTTHNTVIEFAETPSELREVIRESPEIQNRLEISVEGSSDE